MKHVTKAALAQHSKLERAELKRRPMHASL